MEGGIQISLKRNPIIEKKLPTFTFSNYGKEYLMAEGGIQIFIEKII